MESIKDALREFMERLEERTREFKRNNPEELLKKILPEKELEHVRVNYFKDGVLHIAVDSSTWLYYFGTRKEQIRGLLNQESAAVKKIVFRLGEVKKDRL